MSLESSLGLFLDVLIVVLLAAAIGFGFLLHRRLVALREVTEDANGMVGGLDAAAKVVKASLDALDAASKDTGRQLQDEINSARKLRDELQFLTGAGENSLSENQNFEIESVVGPTKTSNIPGSRFAETSALDLAEEVSREAEKSVEPVEATESERELLEALRHVK